MKRELRWMSGGLIFLMVTSGFSQQDGSLKRVLIIGDSVSIGYTSPLTKQLKEFAIVEHNPGNALDSRNILKNLNDWLGDTKWDLIYINTGLHDLRHVDENWKTVRGGKPGVHRNVEPDKYRKNLIAIADRLKQTGANIIFATTTPFPPNPQGPYRDPADVSIYNKIAAEVMSSADIQVDDLYSFVKPRQKELQRHPANVHFTLGGSEVLAQHVADQIREALR